MSTKVHPKTESPRELSSGMKRERKKREQEKKHRYKPVEVEDKSSKYESESSSEDEREYRSDVERRGRPHSRSYDSGTDMTDDDHHRKKKVPSSVDRRRRYRKTSVSPRRSSTGSSGKKGKQERDRKRHYSDYESEEEEEEEILEDPEYVEVAVDRSMPPPAKYQDFVKVDEEGNPVPLKPGEKPTTVRPIPATDAEQATAYRKMQRLLKKHGGKIPVAYIERGNRIYHPRNIAYIYSFPIKNSVAQQKYGFDGEEDIDKPGYVLSELKKLRKKKPRKSKDGKKRKVGGKSWTELYILDSDGMYRRLGCTIPVSHRPCRLPNPETRTKEAIAEKALKKSQHAANASMTTTNTTQSKQEESDEDFLTEELNAVRGIEPQQTKQAPSLDVYLDNLRKMIEQDPNIKTKLVEFFQK